jgi:5'-nucleotidase
MKFLLSNDDGINSDGLLALENIVQSYGEVTVVAPKEENSAISHAITLRRTIRVDRRDNTHIAVHGTPTDCVHLSLTGLLSDIPDVVITGINHGVNLGDDVFYSGTVAAAIEGRFLKYAPVAISMPCQASKYLDTACYVVDCIIQRLSVDPLPQGVVLNVNVPACSVDELNGIQVTRLGKRHRAQSAIKDFDSSGHEIYSYGPVGEGFDVSEGTDFFAVEHDFASITPISLDMTHLKMIGTVSLWAKDF